MVHETNESHIENTKFWKPFIHIKIGYMIPRYYLQRYMFCSANALMLPDI